MLRIINIHSLWFILSFKGYIWLGRWTTYDWAGCTYFVLLRARFIRSTFLLQCGSPGTASTLTLRLHCNNTARLRQHSATASTQRQHFNNIAFLCHTAQTLRHCVNPAPLRQQCVDSASTLPYCVNTAPLREHCVHTAKLRQQRATVSTQSHCVNTEPL